MHYYYLFKTCMVNWYTDLELLNLVIDYENDLNVHGDCDLSCIATRHEERGSLAK